MKLESVISILKFALWMGRFFSINRLNGINTVSYIKQCRDFFRAHHNYRAVHVHIGSSACFVIKEAKNFGIFCIAHSHNTNPSLSLPEIGFRLFSYPTRYIANYYLACSREAWGGPLWQFCCYEQSFLRIK